LSGQLAFDFIRNDTGFSPRIYVLECNPRATSGIHLLANGRSEPEARQLLRSFLWGENSENASPPGITAGAPPAMVASAMLMFAAPPALAGTLRDQRGSKLRASGKSMATFGDHWSAARDVVYRSDDVLPALGQIAGFAEFACRAFRKRESLLVATTADIEWNGELLGLQP
jgi:hypothetical protein